jgi:hypothetical protein
MAHAMGTTLPALDSLLQVTQTVGIASKYQAPIIDHASFSNAIYARFTGRTTSETTAPAGDMRINTALRLCSCGKRFRDADGAVRPQLCGTR